LVEAIDGKPVSAWVDFLCNLCIALYSSITAVLLVRYDTRIRRKLYEIFYPQALPSTAEEGLAKRKPTTATKTTTVKGKGSLVAHHAYIGLMSRWILGDTCLSGTYLLLLHILV